jgi:hypothetical protein
MVGADIEPADIVTMMTRMFGFLCACAAPGRPMISPKPHSANTVSHIFLADILACSQKL